MTNLSLFGERLVIPLAWARFSHDGLVYERDEDGSIWRVSEDGRRVVVHRAHTEKPVVIRRTPYSADLVGRLARHGRKTAGFL